MAPVGYGAGMAEPFKNLFNVALIEAMAAHLARVWPEFDGAGFIAMAADNLDQLELKQRSHRIYRALRRFLPGDFPRAAGIMRAALHPAEDDDLGTGVSDQDGLRGWAIMPMTEYIGLHGLDHFELSMALFKDMTKRHSVEFAIRHFLLAEPERVLAVLRGWCADPNRHVRRLVSEGTRPRLPWAMRLPTFIDDPAPVISLLEVLKGDAEEYVRRSVANNLNDISKDHADLVADLARRWLRGADRDRTRMVRHACRSLIKQGHEGALKALGYGPPKVEIEQFTVTTPKVIFGAALEFEATVRSRADYEQALIVDYIVHHRKAGGATTPKVFKWKTVRLAARGKLGLARKHAIRPITTRVYYPGGHFVEIQINGIALGRLPFELVMEPE